MEHQEILPECVQRFDRLDEKLDELIKRADRINGRYEKHMEESVKYRREVDRHEHLLGVIDKENQLMKDEKWNTSKNSQWRVGLIVGVIMTIFTAIVRFIGG
jgi:hypothetical protein